MAYEKYYTQRIQRLKKRVLDTPPEVDIENAVIVTKAFQETETPLPARARPTSFSSPTMR